MKPGRKSVKSTIGIVFSLTAALALAGFVTWQAYGVLSRAKTLEDGFGAGGQAFSSELKKNVKEGDLPALKAQAAILFRDFPEVRYFSVSGKSGTVYASSRHPRLTVPASGAVPDHAASYIPETPWEGKFTQKAAPESDRVLTAVVQLYDPLDLFEKLKILIFLLLGTLVVTLILQMVLREEEDLSEEAQEEPEEESLSFTSEMTEDLPDLDPLGEPEKEDFWYQEDPEMDSETLTPPGDWSENPIPELELPPLDIPPMEEMPAPPEEAFIAPKEESPVSPGVAADSTPPKPSGPFDSSSGAVWEDFLDPRLESEIRRAADNNQDLVLALISPEDLITGDERKRLRDLLVESFPLKDLIFNRGDRGFTLILPHKTLEAGMKELSLSLKRKEVAEMSSRIVAGLSARSGRLLDPVTLMDEAEKALDKALSGHENLIGFKADPDKYRNFLAKSAKTE